MEFEREQEPDIEPKERAWLWWLGVLALLAGVIAAMWLASRQRKDITQVRVRHLLVRCNPEDPVERAGALERVKELRRRIQAGESFAKLAEEYSGDETSSARGGDLGYYPKNAFEKEFEAYAWSAPIGQLSPPVQTSFGFHLIEVLDRHISKADRYEMELDKKAREAQKIPQTAPPANP